MQNFAKFWSTSKFDGKYLWNGWRYSKSAKYLIDRDSSCVLWEKSGELWSTNCGNLNVDSYPLKLNFSESHISAPKRCCTPKFLHALENDQVLLVHLPLEMGAPLHFFKKGFKIGLNFSKCAPITLGVVRVVTWYFAKWHVSRLGW